MRAIPTKNLTINSVLGENLYTADGKILLKENAILTEKLIYNIDKNKIYTVYVKDKHSDFEVNRLLEQSFRIKGSLLVRKLFDTARMNKSTQFIHEQLSSYAIDVLYELKSSRHQSIEYIDVKNVDAYMYSSAINVALLSALIAWDLNYNDDMVKEIFLGAIYHDIGIALMPEGIINKASDLTREEKIMILNHPNRGYQFLKEKAYISAYVKQIALHHHECMDGTGYPNRASGDEISIISQIIGVADIFDAMTSDRPYKRAVSPHEALEYIIGASSKFNTKVVEAFRKRISPYPRGTIVLLSTGDYAVVEELSVEFPLRPIVKTIKKTDNAYEYETLNLLENNNIVILETIYDNI